VAKHRKVNCKVEDMNQLQNNKSVIPLIGSATDNFYLLGERAKDAIDEFTNQISGLILTPTMGKVALHGLSHISPSAFSPELSQFIDAFAEGCGIKSSVLKSVALIPEFANSHSKWNAQLTSLIPGCTSILEYDKNSEQTIHTRVLDYPLWGTFSENEQSFRLEIPGRQKIFYHSSLVLPFPFLSCMNESGLTICLHQKYSNFFNRKGESIFSIMYELASNAQNIKDIKKILKDKNSITSWNIVCSDNTGRGISIDIRGRDHYREEFNLVEYERPKVINNIPINIDDKIIQAHPINFIQCCLERKKSLELSLQKLNKNKDISIKHIKALIESHQLNPNQSTFQQTSINIATVQIMSFNPADQSFKFLNGASPKFEGDILYNKNVFSDNSFEQLEQIKSLLSPNDMSGNRFIAQAQMYLDKNDIEAAFHYLQMGLAAFDTVAYKNLYRFFYIVLSIKWIDGKNEMSFLYKDLQYLIPFLPKNLQDHAHLISMRLEKILKIPLTDREQIIENPVIIKRYQKEIKLRSTVFTFLMNTTIARMEIPDLLYQS
jgi:hypothetical protein